MIEMNEKMKIDLPLLIFSTELISENVCVWWREKC